MGHGFDGLNGYGRIFFVGCEPRQRTLGRINERDKRKNPCKSVQSIKSVFHQK